MNTPEPTDTEGLEQGGFDTPESARNFEVTKTVTPVEPQKFKPRDVVQNEWREQYDRELDTGVVIKEESPDHYLVARIAKDKDGWYFTGQDVHERAGSMLTPSNIKFEDTGLQI